MRIKRSRGLEDHRDCVVYIFLQDYHLSQALFEIRQSYKKHITINPITKTFFPGLSACKQRPAKSKTCQFLNYQFRHFVIGVPAVWNRGTPKGRKSIPIAFGTV